VLKRMQAEGLGDIPLIIGGIIPDEDAEHLRAIGVAKVYTPKDFELNTIMMDIVALLDPQAVAAQ
jgi:(2R)-ethylmalonyl-CoA mutase